MKRKTENTKITKRQRKKTKAIERREERRNITEAAAQQRRQQLLCSSSSRAPFWAHRLRGSKGSGSMAAPDQMLAAAAHEAEGYRRGFGSWGEAPVAVPARHGRALAVVGPPPRDARNAIVVLPQCRSSRE